MNVWICLLTCLFNLSLFAEEALSQFEKVTGLKGSYNENEKVFKASFPRTDIKVSVDKVILDPFMGLTSWAAFTPVNDQFMVMGDLVLFQDEVNPVMSTLLENGLEVTALHNHFFYDEPPVFFMHISGVGSLQFLSEGVKKALGTVKDIRSKSQVLSKGFGEPSIGEKSSVTSTNLEAIFGTKGQSKDGMFKVVMGRKTKMNGMEVGKDMGVNTWAAFAGSDEAALVDGDFAMEAEELQSVLKTLRKGNINIVAIHNHMTKESPRIIFLHFWGKGKAEALAKTIKEALSTTNDPKTL